MPVLSFSSPGPISANIHLDDSTPIVIVAPIPEAPGHAIVEIGSIEVTARLIGPVPQLELALQEALAELRRRFQ